jgi:hypothetical protein
MATITTKFSIGDAVYHAGTTTEQKRHPCPDCLGKRKWDAKAPSGREYQFDCPRCAAGYRSERDISLEYSAFVPRVQRLTIGQVQARDGGDNPRNEYMCHETGVGSGSVYYEHDLHATEAEAMAAAEAKASLSNVEVPWVVEQFSKSLKICDYQLTDASVQAEKASLQKRRIELNYIIEDIRECISIEEVQRRLAKYDEAMAA